MCVSQTSLMRASSTPNPFITTPVRRLCTHVPSSSLSRNADVHLSFSSAKYLCHECLCELPVYLRILCSPVPPPSRICVFLLFVHLPALCRCIQVMVA